MPQVVPDHRQLSYPLDPARLFEDAEPWSTEWRYRFVPLNRLRNPESFTDHGLERLLYFQLLISDEIESGEPAATC